MVQNETKGTQALTNDLETHAAVEEFIVVSEGNSRARFQVRFSQRTDDQGISEIVSRFSNNVDELYGLDGQPESIVSVYDDVSNVEGWKTASELGSHSRIIVLDFET